METMNSSNENTQSMRIGERIGWLRKKIGLKQEELGRAVGVSTQAVSRWECGGAPDIELLPAIADTLHVSVDELFGRTPTAQADSKELLERMLVSYPKTDRMKAACSLMWDIEKIVLTLEDPDMDRIAIANILDAATQKDEKQKGTSKTASNLERATSGLYIETDSGYMGYGYEKLDYILMLSQPQKGFESVIKDADSLRKLFTLLVKPGCLEVVAALHEKKPGENVTGRLLAQELNRAEDEVIALLDELCSYRLIRNIEISDTNGTMHIYSYENSAEWISFLIFASMLMYTEKDAKLAVNMRKKAALSAPIGTGNANASWSQKKDEERINLYRRGDD